MNTLNVFGLVFVSSVILIVLYVVRSRLLMPLEYRRISSHVPSVTKTLWSEFLVSLELATKRPEGILRRVIIASF